MSTELEYYWPADMSGGSSSHANASWLWISKTVKWAFRKVVTTGVKRKWYFVVGSEPYKELHVDFEI